MNTIRVYAKQNGYYTVYEVNPVELHDFRGEEKHICYFTGMHDKHNKPIYQNDICDFKHQNFSYNYTTERVVVEWDVYNQGCAFYLRSLSDATQYWLLHKGMQNYITVVGNKFVDGKDMV